MELIAGGKSFAEVKIQRVFRRDAPSPFLFVIAIIRVNLILTKYTGGYKLRKSQEKFNQLFYSADTKLFAESNNKTGKP